MRRLNAHTPPHRKRPGLEYMALRCAILDDYQNVALSMADWSKVKGDIDVKVFNEHLGCADKVVAALKGFPSSRHARAHALPARGASKRCPI